MNSEFKNMKRIFGFILVMSLFACGEQETIIFDGNQVGFNLAQTNFLFEATGTNARPVVGIEAHLIAQPRTSETNVTFEILPTSSAIESIHYELESTTAVIPANENSVLLPIRAIPDNFNGGESVSLNLRIVSADNADPSDFSAEATFNITVVCANTIPLDRTWTASIIAGAFGAFSVNPSVTISDAGDGSIIVSDITAGVLPLLGCCDTNESVRIVNICDVITIVGTGLDASFPFETNAGEGFGPGSWDAASQTLIIPWWEPSNAFGAVVQFIPN